MAIFAPVDISQPPSRPRGAAYCCDNASACPSVPSSARSAFDGRTALLHRTAAALHRTAGRRAVPFACPSRAVRPGGRRGAWARVTAGQLRDAKVTGGPARGCARLERV
ncbi:hypothetical protein SSP531S_39160 [Streptomyces spongiicola]|uniref:Uncharacterized protein n=1 Tax=Streptomyces spongiicola TaxID=1690221 RepID=A0A388T0L9_9ACTN|nr:hypothetical protein SSP531S_39160 [Streptomyces spongiicola]